VIESSVALSIAISKARAFETLDQFFEKYAKHTFQMVNWE